jgi:hypothetical protein
VAIIRVGEALLLIFGVLALARAAFQWVGRREREDLAVGRAWGEGDGVAMAAAATARVAGRRVLR